ncbi:hypothetical protein NHX12_020380, partial [Muraenolepis orangiensis]
MERFSVRKPIVLYSVERVTVSRFWQKPFLNEVHTYALCKNTKCEIVCKVRASERVRVCSTIYLSQALQTDVEVLRASVERQKEVLTEKEREMVRRVQAAREEELHKTAVLHEEKLELETHMSELEQQRAQQDEAGHAHREEWEERLRGAQLGEESARKELHNLRTRLHQQTIRLEELERTTGELDDLKRQNQELGVRLGTLAHAEDELQASNRRLKDGQEVLREELRTARSQAERSQHDAERSLEEGRVQWLEEKHTDECGAVRDPLVHSSVYVWSLIGVSSPPVVPRGGAAQ